MILNGHSTCGGQWVNYKTCKTKPLKAMSDCVLHPQTLSISRVSSSLKSQQELRSFSPQAGAPVAHLSAASSPLCGHLGLFTHKISPNLSRKRHSTVSPRASKDANSLFNFKFPPMDKKPRWWWRTLAALPYLMPLHETWMYAETAFHLHPFLEDFEELTYPFLSALGGLPSWFLIAYFIVAYLAVVRRKEWPHFFRFHVVTGMLLEITLQVTGTVWRWLPSAWYWGKVGMHFWTAFAFAFLFTVLECIRCCLAGVYADVPFVSEAAYIQIPYE
ncbi:protein TIC 20-I, chloroplastic-like isoform X1 [Cynara cardunculus var. scolymus]|uniref:protein TIC 20-I, chloroplastic-like isoform X1 n=1 Tax=Cynara cardunculus var. scolymus TaxID=59895 RepID=UPI000D628908|nr:protein TIC 20-I, chloroplastic-like isoform X1 [Cynara cardunculus var. scolymus]